MPMSEYRKIQIEQRELDKKLDEIATRIAKARKERNKYSYVIHTPKEALKRLGERSRTHLNEENLNHNYRRIKKR